MILDDEVMNRPTLTTKLEPFAGLVTQGTQLIVHPASRQRHGEAFTQFSQTVTETLAYCRTNVTTALVNSARTCRNLAANLPYYAAGATTDALHHAPKGYPAVCAGTGPSLVRNMDLLRDSSVRSHAATVSAQTTLRPLLERCIRPDQRHRPGLFTDLATIL